MARDSQAAKPHHYDFLIYLAGIALAITAVFILLGWLLFSSVLPQSLWWLVFGAGGLIAFLLLGLLWLILEQRVFRPLRSMAEEISLITHANPAHTPQLVERHRLGHLPGLAALVPKPRVNLTRFHGVFAPNSKHRALVTPAKRGKGNKANATNADESQTPAERRASMTWAQRRLLAVIRLR